MKRYMVVSVGCLECSMGDAAPESVLVTDDRSEAIEASTKTERSSEYDMFVIDTADGTFITPNAVG